MEIHDAIGGLGVVLILATYALMQLDRTDPRGWRYSLANAVGALLVIYSLTRAFNLSAVVIEASWLVLSVVGLVRAVRRGRGAAARGAPGV